MYECKNGCGYTHHHRGAMNIHEKIHCKQKDDIEGNRCSDCGSSFFYILDPNNRQHIKAIEEGYVDYCAECGELR